MCSRPRTHVTFECFCVFHYRSPALRSCFSFVILRSDASDPHRAFLARVLVGSVHLPANVSLALAIHYQWNRRRRARTECLA
ncbi:hypothetical protein NDU88_000770 [Pleurodeles waltl]|uniref:Uncharacterized protein n=1 Tax=Pleurodeles waltl TaxID=8319 RepID=A0AAV7WK91_PLEWA|nr:hypothetical protein NDU88_000770 [Pleurodeles waltl]